MISVDKSDDKSHAESINNFADDFVDDFINGFGLNNDSSSVFSKLSSKTAPTPLF